MLSRKLLQKLYRWDAVRNFKDDVAVPVRHALFGKKGFYRALDVVKILKKKQSDGEIKTVFDIGASIGEKAYVLARTFPKAAIYCFEPIPESFERLTRRVARFGQRVKCFNFGFYTHDGTLDIHAYDTGDPTSLGASSLIPFEEQARFKDAEDKFKRNIPVTVKRLDDFFKESGLKRIDFMKVDVEGVEKQVFEHGRAALQHTDNLFVEISPGIRGSRSRDHIDTQKLLDDLGFVLEGAYEDFLFTRPPNENH